MKQLYEVRADEDTLCRRMPVQIFGFEGVQSARLFEQNVNSSVDGLKGMVIVALGRSQDMKHVHLGRIEQLFERSADVPHAVRLSQTLRSCFLSIRQANDSGISELLQEADMVLGNMAASNKPYSNR